MRFVIAAERSGSDLSDVNESNVVFHLAAGVLVFILSLVVAKGRKMGKRADERH